MTSSPAFLKAALPEIGIHPIMSRPLSKLYYCRADVQGINYIRGENRVNHERYKTDISWVQFITALLLIPVFVITGILFTIVDLFGADRRARILKGSDDPES